jgi:hypothetical protein
VTSAGVRQSTVWLHDARGDRQISSESFATVSGLGFTGSGVQSAFSSDGKRLFYLVRKEGSRSWQSGELWVADLGSGQTEAVLPGISMSSFDLARDGKRVAFASPNEEGSSRVWIASLDRRTPPQPITSFEADGPYFGPAGDLFFRMREGSSFFVYHVERDGTQPRKMNAEPVPYILDISPDGEWLLNGALSPNMVLAAYPMRGGSPVRICDFCDAGWGSGGKLLYLRFRGVGAMGGGKTLVIGLPVGKQLPALPPDGLRSPEDVKGVNVVGVIDMTGITLFAPGPNPSIYAYSRMTVQRNLFRVPLN